MRRRSPEPEPLDVVDQEFYALLREHWDRPPAEEFWERHWRQGATCLHGNPTRRCVKCKLAKPTVSSGWGQ